MVRENNIKAENTKKKKGTKNKSTKTKLQSFNLQRETCMIFFEGWMEEVLMNEEPNHERKKIGNR